MVRRVLHITRDFPPNINGGLSVAVGGLVEAQVRAGIECIVVSFDNYRPSGGSVKREPNRTTTISGITIIRVGGKAALARAQELAVNFVAEVVHVHHELLWEFASDVARFNRSPTVFTVHVLQSEQNRLRDVKTTQSSEAQKRAMTECSVLHAPSQAVADLLIESTLRLGGRLRVVRLGCDDWPGATLASEEERFEGPPSILYVGRFADVCGFAEFLEALPPLLGEIPTLEVTIAGGMPDNPRADRRWKKRWQKLGGVDASRVRWVGWRSSDELSELYGAATMLVVPSWFETFGQVALEGMLHGTPLITTGAGALAELVSDESALLIEVKDSEAIVAAALTLLAEPERAEQRRNTALAKAQEGYHWDDRIDAFRSLYRAAIES